MRPMTMTMATHETMSAWFWMTNSWLRTGKFLLAADFLPLIGAIFPASETKLKKTLNAHVDARKKPASDGCHVRESVEWTGSRNTMKYTAVGARMPSSGRRTASEHGRGGWSVSWACGSRVGRLQVADVSAIHLSACLRFSRLITYGATCDNR